MSEPLCYAPFIGLFSSESGYAPCCVYKGSIKANSPSEYWISEDVVDIRKKMFEEDLPKGCEVCKRNINKGLDSDLSFWKSQYDTALVGINIKSGNETNDPLALDFRPGNHCNLKCRMCGPGSSDQIEKEIRDNPVLKHFYSPASVGKFNLQATIDYIKGKSFQKIKVLGGEPSIDPSVFSFLENLSPDVRLEITTNATSINSKFIKLLKKFNDLHITISVDAVGPTYEYIRTNARWDIVDFNVDKLFVLDAKSYKFNVVLMPYNIFNLKELVLWFKSLRDKRYKFDVWYCNSDSTKTSLTNVKDYHREQVMDELISTKDVEGYKLIDILSTFQYTDNKSFISLNNALDNVRKTKLTDLDIRFKEYI